MTNAVNARYHSILNSPLKEVMQDIQKQVRDAMSKGQFSVDLDYRNLSIHIINLYKDNGYKVNVNIDNYRNEVESYRISWE